MQHDNRRMRTLLATAALVLAGAIAAGAQNAPHRSSADLTAQKFSPLTEITPANVRSLRMAWRARTGDVSTGAAIRDGRKVPATEWSATPLFVNDTLYVGTPFYRVFALEPDSGKVKWVYDTKAELDAGGHTEIKNHGVAYWQADNATPGRACDKRIYIGTVDAKLHAIDADSGKPCADFGDNGVLDVDQWNVTNRKWPLALFQPPTVFRDTLFLGWSGMPRTDSEATPGSLFAIDARTGALRWTFEPIPEDVNGKTGHANVFAAMSVDAERNLLFVPVSSPSPSFFGGNRLDDLPNTGSLTALNIENGQVVWSRQFVHHDLWDYGTNSAPTLIDIAKDGVTIPALVQTSKQGFLYVLNRQTGEPVYPIAERGVPKSGVPGEVSSPTQPFADLPPPVTDGKWPGVFNLSDWASAGFCSRIAKRLKHEGRFTPPSLEGSLIFPGSFGGVGSGGGATDPAGQSFVVNASQNVQIYRLFRRSDFDNVDNGEAAGYFPMTGTPYGVRVQTFRNAFGMPCWNPPYGTLSSYDLKTGKLNWRKPFGQIQRWGFYMPEAWGTMTVGAPAITASGLIFIGASTDSRVRAIDLKTGDMLWKHVVPAPAAASPAIYQYKGKQYVVFSAGGHPALGPKASDEVMAFALP
jgi:quinoprotein glucose dehydrogenase